MAMGKGQRLGVEQRDGHHEERLPAELRKRGTMAAVWNYITGTREIPGVG